MPKGKGTGKACGNGFIAAWKTCRDGESGAAHPDFVVGGKEKADKLQAEILSLLEEYTPEQQEVWEKHITDSFKKHGESRLKTKEEVYLMKLEGWVSLLRNGPPSVLYDQNGEPDGSSLALVPQVTGTTGAPSWKAVDRGVSYKFDPGRKGEQGKWKQCTVSMYNDIVSGRVQAAINLYHQKKEEAERTGKPIDYPVTNFGRPVDPKEVDHYLALIKAQGDLSGVAGNGTNRNASVKLEDNPTGRELVAAVQNSLLRYDPLYADARAREIIAAWIRQDKVSSFTGLPVSIPAVRDKDGYPSVVDHNTPLSSAWAGNKSAFNTKEQAESALRQFDREGNFSITERGLNTAKSDMTDWDEIIGVWQQRVADFERNQVEARSVVSLARPTREQLSVSARNERGDFDDTRAKLEATLPKETVRKVMGPAPKRVTGKYLKGLVEGYLDRGMSRSQIVSELVRQGVSPQMIVDLL